MNLQGTLQEKLIKALKARDEAKTGVLRMILAQIKEASIEKQAKITDEEVADILRRQQKQRIEAIKFYQKAGRKDLVEKEEAEKKIIESFLKLSA